MSDPLVNSFSSSARARGFSLLEVMVSLVVICVGLLGIAKLQALSLSSTTTSRLRALAAIQAASIASAMHSNRQYWGATPPNTVTVAGGTITSTDAGLQAAAGAGNAGTVCWSPTATANSGPACTAVGLAAFDLVRWNTSLTALLPNPQALITCPPVPGGAAPASCAITVCWTERAVAVNQQEAAAAATPCNGAGATQGAVGFQLPTYTLYVEP